LHSGRKKEPPIPKNIRNYGAAFAKPRDALLWCAVFSLIWYLMKELDGLVDNNTGYFKTFSSVHNFLNEFESLILELRFPKEIEERWRLCMTLTLSTT
jgi:hypothetical protein